MWHSQIPQGDPADLAKLLFCVENPPGTTNVSGSQDQLGIVMPGVNKLNYDNGYWPVSVESSTDCEILNFAARHINLIMLPPRANDYNVFANSNVNVKSAAKLADAANRIWGGLLAKDIVAWGKATTDCFEAQLEMFPEMCTSDMKNIIEKYRDVALGWKVSGSGGGGYFIMISEDTIPDAIKVVPRS